MPERIEFATTASDGDAAVVIESGGAMKSGDVDPAVTSPPVGTKSSALGLLAVGGAILAFSLSTPIVKWSGVTGVVLSFWRMWASAALWWFALAVMRARSRQRGHTVLDWPSRRTWTLVGPAGLMFGVNISLLFTAVTRTSIAHIEFIGAMTPLIIVPAGALLFGERPNWGALRFGVISIIGVSLVLFFGPVQGAATLGGDLVMVVTLISWTAYLLFTKRARAAGVDTTTFMACMMSSGLITAAPITLLTVGGEIFGLATRGWIVVALLAVLTGMVAHGCIAFAHQHLPIATITVMQTCQPALAVVAAFFILGESVRAIQVVGMGLVVIGIALFTSRAQRRPPA